MISRKDRVLAGKLWMPSHLSPECHALLRGLLTVDPAQRLGAGGAEDLRNHGFFKLHHISWDEVACRRHRAPFIPELRDGNDMSKFDVFTCESVDGALGGTGAGEAWEGYSFDGGSVSQYSLSDDEQEEWHKDPDEQEESHGDPEKREEQAHVAEVSEGHLAFDASWGEQQQNLKVVLSPAETTAVRIPLPSSKSQESTESSIDHRSQHSRVSNERTDTRGKGKGKGKGNSRAKDSGKTGRASEPDADHSAVGGGKSDKQKRDAKDVKSSSQINHGDQHRVATNSVQGNRACQDASDIVPMPKPKPNPKPKSQSKPEPDSTAKARRQRANNSDSCSSVVLPKESVAGTKENIKTFVPPKPRT